MDVGTVPPLPGCCEKHPARERGQLAVIEVGSEVGDTADVPLKGRGHAYRAVTWAQTKPLMLALQGENHREDSLPLKAPKGAHTHCETVNKKTSHI